MVCAAYKSSALARKTNRKNSSVAFFSDLLHEKGIKVMFCV